MTATTLTGRRLIEALPVTSENVPIGGEFGGAEGRKRPLVLRLDPDERPWPLYILEPEIRIVIRRRKRRPYIERHRNELHQD